MPISLHARLGQCVRVRKHLLLVAGIAVLAMPLTASAAAEQSQFDGCIDELRERAIAEGIPAATATDALAGVTFEQRVIDADRRQPEFTQTFADYLGRRLTPERIAKGRELLQTHGQLLERIAAEYGVPPQYLISFWGLETNFGNYFGSIPVLNSLATLACDPRRAGYFTAELLNALRIVDRNNVKPERMVGSWAGAMGHTQFMPSVWLQYAVDADGDGKVDLWGSVPDALTSAANFLRGIGWEPGLRWGREVLLPQDFDYAQAGRDRVRALPAWRELGVTTTAGTPLPALPLEAGLVVPSGHRGPAFLVYDNFDTIMRWNRSEYYALSVGLLADRIAGAGPLHNPPPTDAPRLSRAQVEAIQARLTALGFDAGEADGVFGPATRQAIRGLQQARGWIADGYPGRQLLDALGIDNSDG